jgi:hypothetical protein
MLSGRPMVMGTQPEPSILGFHYRRLQESGVYILGFDTRRVFSLALAAARRCCVLTNFFLVDNQSLSLQSLVCAFNYIPHNEGCGCLLAGSLGRQRISLRQGPEAYSRLRFVVLTLCLLLFFFFLGVVFLSSEKKQECVYICSISSKKLLVVLPFF